MTHEEEIQILQAIEAALDRGDPQQACALLSERAKPKQKKQGFRGGVTYERLRLLDAIAHLRAAPNQLRAELLLMAVEREQKSHPDAPELKARRAEALAYQSEHLTAWPLAEQQQRQHAAHVEARQLLEALDKADLMVDSAAYSLLARLRGEDGDPSGARRAQERCQQIAKNPAVQCPASVLRAQDSAATAKGSAQ